MSMIGDRRAGGNSFQVGSDLGGALQDKPKLPTYHISEIYRLKICM